MEYVLTTNKLCKKYKHFHALKDIDMHIPEGGIYGLVGKNGAGKTTLIRLICGLQDPTEGEYSLYGVSYTDKKIVQSRRRIGALVETPSVYTNLTAEQNLREQYLVLGLPTFEGIGDILKVTGLENAGKKKVKNFSLGMRQRLGIAVALCGNPDFLILDEPINGLDPQAIIELRELIMKLNKEQQVTFLISSHILDELSRLATCYGFINNGRIIEEISASDMKKVCRKSLRIEVKSADINLLSRILNDKKIEYKIISEQTADVYDKININELILLLASKKCEIISINTYNENLESHYINLLRGNENA